MPELLLCSVFETLAKKEKEEVKRRRGKCKVSRRDSSHEHCFPKNLPPLRCMYTMEGLVPHSSPPFLRRMSTPQQKSRVSAAPPRIAVDLSSVSLTLEDKTAFLTPLLRGAKKKKGMNRYMRTRRPIAHEDKATRTETEERKILKQKTLGRKEDSLRICLCTCRSCFSFPSVSCLTEIGLYRGRKHERRFPPPPLRCSIISGRKLRRCWVQNDDKKDEERKTVRERSSKKKKRPSEEEKTTAAWSICRLA